MTSQPPTTTQAPAPGPLASALLEALPRLYGGPGDPLILELIAALGGALERGQLELTLEGSPPPEVSGEHWPQGHLRALVGSPLLARPDTLADAEGHLRPRYGVQSHGAAFLRRPDQHVCARWEWQRRRTRGR